MEHWEKKRSYSLKSTLHLYPPHLKHSNFQSQGVGDIRRVLCRLWLAKHLFHQITITFDFRSSKLNGFVSEAFVVTQSTFDSYQNKK